MKRKVLISNAVVLLFILGLNCFAQTQKSGVPTKIMVRVVARDAKIIYDNVGGAKITIKDVASGKVLAEGIQKGGSGDTVSIMIKARERGAKVFDTDGAAGFLATLTPDKPALVEISAEAPLNFPQSTQRASKTVLIIPGQDILGEGIILEVHGFIVDLLTPQTEIQKGQTIGVRATVMMMCGCPIEADGLWDANKIRVTARLVRAGQTIKEIPLYDAGEKNTFTGKLPLKDTGKFDLQILAMDAANANFGMAEKSIVVGK